MGVVNATAVRMVVNTFLCPSDPRQDRLDPAFGPNNYVANAGTGLQTAAASGPKMGPGPTGSSTTDRPPRSGISPTA